MTRPPVPETALEQSAPVVYLDNACMGRPTAQALAEVRALVERVGRGAEPPTDLVVDLQRSYDRARRAVASLVGARYDEVALVESTSHGLGLVAASLPLERGDNVLVSDLEFFPPVLCWRGRCAADAVEVRPVPHRAGRLRPEDFAACMDERTRVLVVSAVQEVGGFRADLAAFAALARERGAWLLVDGVQEVGALQVDLSTGGVHAYCAGGHKWLRNPFGRGFLYVHTALAATLEPPFYGYFAAGEPAAGWEAYLASPERSAFDPLAFDRGMARFEMGGFGNYAGAVALAATVENLLALGPARVEQRVFALCDRLVTGLEEVGLEIRSAREPEHRSGIVCVGLPGGPEEEQRFVAWLRERGVFVSVRYTAGMGGVRVSPHYDNTEAEVDRLVEAAAAWLTGEAG